MCEYGNFIMLTSLWKVASFELHRYVASLRYVAKAMSPHGYEVLFLAAFIRMMFVDHVPDENVCSSTMELIFHGLETTITLRFAAAVLCLGRSDWFTSGATSTR